MINCRSIKFYAEAETVDKNNSVYPSNLSASLYEIGHYASCIDAIQRAGSRKPHPALAAKLSTRLAKALTHAAQNGTISASKVKEHSPAFEALEVVGKLDGIDHTENEQAWQFWKQIQADLKDREKLSHEAKVRLSRFPIFRGTP